MEEEEEYSLIFKIILIGDNSVGKTNILINNNLFNIIYIK